MPRSRCRPRDVYKRQQLENAEIKSPIDGTVVRVNTKVGRFADTTENDVPLFVIENLDVLEMKINVSEYSIGQIKKGQEAVITADILNGREVKGVVTDISPTGEEKGGGSTERVKMCIRDRARSGQVLVNQYEQVMPGCTAFVLDLDTFHYIRKQKDDCGTVTEEAVFEEDSLEQMLSLSLIHIYGY